MGLQKGVGSCPVRTESRVKVLSTGGRTGQIVRTVTPLGPPHRPFSPHYPTPGVKKGDGPFVWFVWNGPRDRVDVGVGGVCGYGCSRIVLPRTV